MAALRRHPSNDDATVHASCNGILLFNLKNCYMVLNDVSILTKKILVGVFIYLVPLAIIGGSYSHIKIFVSR